MTDRQCLDNATLMKLLHGSADQAMPSDVVTHLDECTSCQARLESVSGLMDLDVINDQAVLEMKGDTRLDWFDGVADCDAIAPSEPTSTGGAARQSSSIDYLTGLLGPARTELSCGALGPYDVLDICGKGGMGIVVRANDPSLSRVVAIKLLSPGLLLNDQAHQRFLREAQTAASIEHENVVTIHAVDDWHGVPYLVMQFVDGPTLRDVVDEQGRLSAERVIRYGIQIADGLAAAHGRGLIHRDIKPSNLILDIRTDTVRISDFGLARPQAHSGLTESGVIPGTPQFMSPEQATGSELDHRADLFSLGSVLFWLATAAEPYSAESTFQLLKKICEQKPPSVRQVRTKIPTALADVIDQLMTRDPADRFADAAAVSSALKAIDVGKHDRSNDRQWIRRSAGSLITLTLVLLGTAALAWSFGLFESAENKTVDQLVAPQLQRGTFDDVVPRGFTIRGGTASFASLHAAIEAAASGDVIEVHEERVVLDRTVALGDRDLTIAAGRNVVPRIRFAPENGQKESMISSQTSCTLIGLDLVDTDTGDAAGVDGGANPAISVSGDLKILNCQVNSEVRSCIRLAGHLTIRNSFLRCTQVAVVDLSPLSANVMEIENSILLGPFLLNSDVATSPANAVAVRITRCSLGCGVVLRFRPHVPERTNGRLNAVPVEMVVVRTLIVAPGIVRYVVAQNAAGQGLSGSRVREKEYFRQLVVWKDDQNIYDDRVDAFLEVVSLSRRRRWVGSARDVRSWLVWSGQSADAAMQASIMTSSTAVAPSTIEDIRVMSVEPLDVSLLDSVGPEIDRVGPWATESSSRQRGETGKDGEE
jgi:Protein kinase domain